MKYPRGILFVLIRLESFGVLDLWRDGETVAVLYPQGLALERIEWAERVIKRNTKLLLKWLPKRPRKMLKITLE